MQIKNCTENTTIAERVVEAQSFFARLKGLLGRSELNSGEALVIPNCRCIHMFGMRFSIDAIFTDRHNRIVRLIRGLKPGSVSSYVFSASKVIELPTGTIDRTYCKVGDQLAIA